MDDGGHSDYNISEDWGPEAELFVLLLVNWY